MKRPLLLLLLLLWPGVLLAKPRVALVKFENDSGGEVQEIVNEVLDGDTTIVGPKEVNRTVDKLGLSEDMTERELKKLATELDVDAVVQGKIGKKGDNRIARFKVYANGKKKGFSVEFSNVKSERLKTAIHEKLLEKIGSAKKSSDDEGDDDKKAKKAKKAKRGTADDEEDPTGDDDRKAKKAKRDDDEEAPAKRGDDEEDRPKKSDEEATNEDEEDRPRRGKKRTSRRDDDEDPSGEVRGSLEDDESSSKRARAANRFAVRLDVGISVTKRTLAFTSRNFPEAPNPYANNPVPGLRVDGEIYPLAFQNPKSPAAGIGIAGEYDKVLSLNVQSSKQPGTKFPVNQQHWLFGLRYRVPFGSGPTSPSVTLGASYGHKTFKVNRAALEPGNTIDLPDVDYKGFFPGIDIRVPLAAQAALFVGGRAILVTGAGQIQENTSYGQAKITGGEGTAGVDIVLGNRFALRVAGEFCQLGYAFTGTGMLTNNRDGDPTTKDVGGAADRYIGGVASLAVLY